jgi:hypothetical protein
VIAPEKVSLSDFVTRRLNPVKVTLALLRHEAAQHTQGERTMVDRAEFLNILATLELFVEDYEKLVTREPRALPPLVSAPVGDRTTSYVSDARS